MITQSMSSCFQFTIMFPRHPSAHANSRIESVSSHPADAEFRHRFEEDLIGAGSGESVGLIEIIVDDGRFAVAAGGGEDVLENLRDRREVRHESFRNVDPSSGRRVHRLVGERFEESPEAPIDVVELEISIEHGSDLKVKTAVHPPTEELELCGGFDHDRADHLDPLRHHAIDEGSLIPRVGLRDCLLSNDPINGHSQDSLKLLDRNLGTTVHREVQHERLHLRWEFGDCWTIQIQALVDRHRVRFREGRNIEVRKLPLADSEFRFAPQVRRVVGIPALPLD